VEALTWRVAVAGPRGDLDLRLEAAKAATAQKGTRPVYFGGEARFLTTPVYDRYALRAGDRLEGPLIIEERESTTVVDPRCVAEVDAQRNLLLTLRQA
jgi:N-methylhydantoinase A